MLGGTVLNREKISFDIPYVAVSWRTINVIYD